MQPEVCQLIRPLIPAVARMTLHMRKLDPIIRCPSSTAAPHGLQCSLSIRIHLANLTNQLHVLLPIVHTHDTLRRVIRVVSHDHRAEAAAGSTSLYFSTVVREPDQRLSDGCQLSSIVGPCCRRII